MRAPKTRRELLSKNRSTQPRNITTQLILIGRNYAARTKRGIQRASGMGMAHGRLSPYFFTLQNPRMHNSKSR